MLSEGFQGDQKPFNLRDAFLILLMRNTLPVCVEPRAWEQPS